MEKEKLSELDRLEELPYSNDEYPLWHKVIEGVLREVFGSNSHEYRDFAQAYSHVSHMGEDKQRKYSEELEMRKTALLSIIQVHELVGIDTKPLVGQQPPKAFIAHGKKSVALTKLQEFLRALGVEPLVVKEQPSLDKTLDDKVNYYLSQADFVIILATADDKVGEKLQPRQNVIHEIGLAQKTHGGKIIYLLEEGAEFPSNIRPKVYEPFKQRNMMNAFLHIAKELRAYGILKCVKP